MVTFSDSVLVAATLIFCKLLLSSGKKVATTMVTFSDVASVPGTFEDFRKPEFLFDQVSPTKCSDWAFPKFLT